MTPGARLEPDTVQQGSHAQGDTRFPGMTDDKLTWEPFVGYAVQSEWSNMDSNRVQVVVATYDYNIVYLQGSLI